jgi:hypothetical protein
MLTIAILAIFCLAAIGLVLIVALCYFGALVQETRNEQLGIKDELQTIQSYVEGTHHLALELQILTPKGKKAASEFMNFTTAGTRPFNG